MKSKINHIIILAAGCMLFLNGCKKELSEKRYTKDDQKLITSYVEGNDSLKSLSALLIRANRESLLNTYGSYTLFAPTDKAFASYLSSIGKNSIADLTDDEVNVLINYHILTNKVTLKALNIGLVSDSTVNGLNVLYTAKGNDIYINKVAKVDNTIEVSNGFVYILNTVLAPPAANAYDYLVSTGKFTIMTQVFDQAGLKDTLQTVQMQNPYTDLNFPIKLSFTMFVESDEVLKNKGINSYADLKKAIIDSSKRWTIDENQALNAFARYHFCSGVKFMFQLFLNDGINEDNLLTWALNRSKVIHTNAFFDQLPKLNATIINGNVSGGISFFDAQSDKIVKNGVVHMIDGILFIPASEPRAVFIKRECEHGDRGYFTSLGEKIVLQDARISNGYVSLWRSSLFTTDEADYWHIGMAIRFQPQDVGDYIEFDLKDVPKGNYLIMLNYQKDQVNASRNVNVYIRKSSEAFDYKQVPLYTGLDMANVLNTAPVDRDFGQMKLLRPKTNPYNIPEYGDYTIRFAHADLYYGTYDAIILQPVN